MRLAALFLTLLIVSCQSKNNRTLSNQKMESSKVEFAMVIHGGAGTITKENMTSEKETEYRNMLKEVLELGESMLQKGQEAEDVVVACIALMEDSPLFNAGKGAVFTNKATNEMDASIMRGTDQEAGSIAGVTNIKNPITAALAVMNNSEHVLLSGKGAEEFALKEGCEIVDPDFFYTERRMKSLERVKRKEKESGKDKSEISEDSKHGTVGCVVLDKMGNIVAGTSTGGMTNKKYNRIGDSPIIGAGTYADNESCGVSSTGHGEYFIRYAVAHDISARMKYKNISLRQAADEVVMDVLVKKGGSGGVVALDKYGNIAMPHNTSGMYRGYVKPGELFVGIYKEDTQEN